MPYKVIVAHPGRQHSFQTAAALKHSDMLCKYVTTIYDSDSSLLMKILKQVLPEKELQRAAGRKSEELEDRDVLCFCETSGFIEALLNRIDKKRKIYRWWHDRLSDRFGRKIALLAIREQADAVIMYDTTAKKCFEILKTRAPNIVRAMDCSAANRIYMRQVYQNDAQHSPTFAQRILRERGHLSNDRYCQRLTEEMSATELFLAPSYFVKKSLEYSGVRESQILLCPYGTNFSPVFLQREVNWNRPLQALYVGNATAMKGIHYLLQAVDRLQGKVELTIVGGYDNSDHLFDPYLKSVHFVGRVPHGAVQDYLRKADVFVFPSLGEGLSLSVLEAMSYSLLCIVSENSGANDAIEDGVNGFVIAPHSVDAIVEKLIWCCENRDKLPEMGQAAYKAATQYTWKIYGERLTATLNDYLTKRATKCMD